MQEYEESCAITNAGCRWALDDWGDHYLFVIPRMYCLDCFRERDFSKEEYKEEKSDHSLYY